MKFLALVVLIFASIAQAKDCWLSYDENETYFVDCRIGPVPPNYKRICRMVDENRVASDYKIEIQKRELGLIDKAKELIGLDADLKREWSKDARLDPDEEIICTIDEVKKQERLNAIEAARQAEEAKKAKKDSDWATACSSVKAGSVEALVCLERGY